MTDLQLSWTDLYDINTYEVDANQRAGLVMICRFLQESAGRHARHLGFGYMDAQEVQQIWVLSRLLVKMEQYPTWGSKIRVRTWPRGVEGLAALRDFEITHESGARLGAATSQWLILDAETHRPQPALIVRDILPLLTGESAMEEQPRKIQIPQSLDFLAEIKVQYSDIDLYKHVNNTRYIEWVINAFPEEYHENHHLYSFLIEFVSETKLGDVVQLFGNITPENSLFRAVRTEDDKTVFRAQSIWR